MTIRLPHIAILGAGSMGGAILAGLRSPEVDVVGGIAVTNRTEAKAAALRGPHVQSFALESDPEANARALAGARMVILGVKPAMVPDLLVAVRDDLDPEAIVVSVAAGVTTATLESSVPNAVARAMPNTPALVRRAVTGVARGSRISDDDLALVRRLFGTVGAVLDVPEEQIDALSTISGSGPAYVFLLMERLTQTARKLGFGEADARLMVEQTFLGAAELLAAGEDPPAELRRRVTSPGGTTARAIAVLDEADLTDLFDRATAAALARARELAGGG